MDAVVLILAPFCNMRACLSLSSMLQILTISALKDLPMAFFPPVFKDAFTGKQTNILRAMVVAWPFPCHPINALMKTPNLKALKAVLGGLDLLINQKYQLR